MKTRLLFVNESLHLAGGEKSLIALLSNLDPELYEIDLQLFRYGGELDALIPDYVNILPPFKYTEFTNNSWAKNLQTITRKKHASFLKSRLKYSLAIRTGNYNHPQKAQFYWESVKNVIPETEKEYDVAIAYAQGIPTFYVMDKVAAKKKVAWVNVSLEFLPENKIYNQKYYQKYDTIVPVSDVTYKYLEEVFPEFKQKLYTIYDIIDYKSMVKMSEMKEVHLDGAFKMLTVSRLNGKQKGYDMTMEACRLLKERGLSFHWYAIGQGPYRKEIEAFIKEHQLENYFTLLGTKANPYPYYKAVDLYVQTSRHEGYGLSIAEARLLNTPVVTTKYDTVFVQMVQEKNGLVVEMNAEAIADGIERIMKDKSLYDSIKEYLTTEQKENLEPVERFNQMIAGNKAF